MEYAATPAELAEKYRQMTDDELLRLALDSESLLPDAQMALSQEVQRRHLDTPERIAQFQEEQKRHIAKTSFDVTELSPLRGFKKRLYGKANYVRREKEEEYDTTLFGVVFFFPLLPLGTFRVARNLKSKKVEPLEKKELRWSQVWWVWLKAVLAIIVMVTVLSFVISHT
jgi:hypothetical protein